MKVAIVVNNEEWFRGEAKEFLMLVKPDGEIQIAFNHVAETRKKVSVKSKPKGR